MKYVLVIPTVYDLHTYIYRTCLYLNLLFN